MNVTYEKKKAMTFIGYHTEILPNEGYVKCPEFWDKEYCALPEKTDKKRTRKTE